MYPQSPKNGRIEIEVSSLSDEYFLLPVGQNGVLLFGESEKTVKGNTQYDFTKFDVNFKKEWVANVLIQNNLNLSKQYYDAEGEKLYLLMTRNRNGFLSSDFQVVELDVKSQESKIIKGVFQGKVFINDFYASHSIVYFGGGLFPPSTDAFLKQTYSLLLLYIPTFFGSMNYKLKPLLYMADFRKMNVLPYLLDLKGSSKVTSISPDKETQTTNVFMTNKQSKDNINFNLWFFDKEGVKKQEVPLKVNENIDITSGKVLSQGNDEQVVIGTYNIRPKRYKESYFDVQNTISTTSTGIYFSEIKGGEQQFLKAYPFSKFSNFYSFLSIRAKNKMSKKIARKAAKGKSFDLQYNILFDNLVKVNNEYIMIAEAYYPEYETHCYTDFNPNGTTTQRCYTVFVGYRFTHAVVAGFNTEGELLWDNSFEIMDILTYDLKPKVKFLMENNEILLLYSFGGQIKSTVISGGKVIEGKNRVNIDTGISGDKVKEDYSSGIEYWYDNYFIAYGYQKIKNTSSTGKNKRRVFYFNKIAYK